MQEENVIVIQIYTDKNHTNFIFHHRRNPKYNAIFYEWTPKYYQR